MKQGLIRTSRYSPGNMDRNSLESLFVGRDEIMGDVVDRIESSIENGEKHYLLLVGPRGSGKTHLVALAYHRIAEYLSTHEKSNHAVIALLNEEEWGVTSYLDFIVRILRALTDNAPELNNSISNIYEAFAGRNSDAELLAENVLTKFVGRKTLILICENLVDLFAGLDHVGQERWRAFIQESGFWTILATTPALFTSVTLQKNPFFGFFTIRELKKLRFDEALELLIKKASHDSQPELVEFLRTPIGRARVRAIHHLAGGNHRAYVVLFDFLDKQSLDDLIDPFINMVDDLTPYYQDQMRQLAPRQRKIVEHLCHATRPLLIKEIATSCLMTH
ncbi:MAG: AAA family ATPase, partial [Nitrososphaerales archaeon]